jgi:hypothetical protein
MTNPSDVVRQVMQQPEMAVLLIDGTAALRQMVNRFLTGLYFEQERPLA